MNMNILGRLSVDIGDVTKAWFQELRVLHTTWKLEQRLDSTIHPQKQSLKRILFKLGALMSLGTGFLPTVTELVLMFE